jgi:hypothetical protein
MYLQVFFEPKLDLERLRPMLDTCGHWSRRNAIRGLSKQMMAALFEASADADPLTLDDIVPATEPLVEVIQHGRNSLPLFNNFQKRFCKPDGEGAGDVLWGYNHADTSVFTGPGYFVARIEDKELVVDYGALPPRKPASWPEIIPNSARIGRFVWVGMVDRVRRVSTHVSIGRAWRGGKASDDYFALCREDPKTA